MWRRDVSETSRTISARPMAAAAGDRNLLMAAAAGDRNLRMAAAAPRLSLDAGVVRVHEAARLILPRGVGPGGVPLDGLRSGARDGGAAWLGVGLAVGSGVGVGSGLRLGLGLGVRVISPKPPG